MRTRTLRNAIASIDAEQDNRTVSQIIASMERMATCPQAAAERDRFYADQRARDAAAFTARFGCPPSWAQGDTQ